MNILRTAKIWFAISMAAILVSLWVIWAYGFRLGVDFAGGALLEVKLDDPVAAAEPSEAIVQAYRQTKGFEVIPQATAEGRFLVRSKSLTNEEKDGVLQVLRQDFASVTEERFEMVSPLVSRDVIRKAVLAALVAIIGILIYISLSFRRVPKPFSAFKFAAAAVLALVHDALILLGAYALLGHFRGAEMDSLFITALLTLLGFSVHDTIVTFDRIRENLRRREAESFEQIASRSVLETVIRSINTSYTLALVLLAIVLFGGTTLRFFTLALLIGVIVGTYSSIFIATPILVWWHRRVKSGG